MTTIVVDRQEGIMVADRAISSTSGQIPWTKLRRLQHGRWADSVFGASGMVSAFITAEKILNLEEGSSDYSLPLHTDPGDEEYFEVVLLTPDLEIVTFDRWMVPVVMEVDFYATGSGAEFALGAMDAGASAIEAIKIACARDKESSLLGKAPQVMRIKT